jgi:hypothetical protein
MKPVFPFQVSDKVVCIYDSPNFEWQHLETAPEVGRVYCVSAIRQGKYKVGFLCQLVGINRQDGTPQWFFASRFMEINQCRATKSAF